MKKMTILASALLLVGLTSCKKEYTCKCTAASSVTFLGIEVPAPHPTDGTTETTEKKKKNESEDWCKSLEKSTVLSNVPDGLGGTVPYTQKTTCTL